jgi:HemY protein
LRWDEAAASSIESALDTKWDESLAALYGRLPVPQDRSRLDARRGHAERWVQARPMSPALLVTLARIALQQGQWPQAEGYLHRAVAQGAGSEAWEELGHGYAAIGDEARARQSYVNALRATRGETVSELPGRDLRQKIFDQAAVEERDEHGVPRLRG